MDEKYKTRSEVNTIINSTRTPTCSPSATRHSISTTTSTTTAAGFSRRSTRVEHGSQRVLLSAGDGERPVRLYRNPAAGVGAVEARQRWLPRVRAFVALGLVDLVGDGPELGARQVVGELLALGRGPGIGTGLIQRLLVMCFFRNANEYRRFFDSQSRHSSGAPCGQCRRPRRRSSWRRRTGSSTCPRWRHRQS